MIKTSARRITLALALGVSTIAAVGVAHAQSVTGTDPVPKGCGCVTQPPSTDSAAPVSTPSTVAQSMLVFLGLA